MKEKYRDGGWRNEIPNFDLIANHEAKFRENITDIYSGDNGLATVIDVSVDKFRVEKDEDLYAE